MVLAPEGTSVIVAVSMMRDEADICRSTVRHLYSQGVDLVIVADNLSTDLTPEILRTGTKAEVVTDRDPAYWQGRKMTDLARLAYDRGADWVLPFDADEIWYSPTGTIADTLNNCPADVLYCQGWDHVARHDDPSGHPFKAMQHRRTRPQLYPKVVFRTHPDARLDEGNHDVARPGGLSLNTGVLEYRHFQYRTLEQFARKVRQGAAALELTDLPDSTGAHWRRFAAMTDDELEQEWLALCSEPGLIFDPAPC